MGDIVRTIKAAQHRVFRAGLDQLLVVQGGPGTGKTVVALHRVSWLLYNHRDTLRPSDVLVVGPNPTFVRYIRNVLPSLGDRDVQQLPLAALGPEVRLGRVEPPEVVALKGSARMAGLLDRALAQRVSMPAGLGPLELPVGNRVVRFDRRTVQAELDRLASSPYAVGRQALREFLVRGVRQEANPEARADVADPLLDRIWPQFTAPAFLRDLLNSEQRLLRAAGDHFTAREVVALRRRAADRLSEERWSLADVALLDHVQARMTGQPPRRFRHVVVDEAQDLSPMQLASIGRRSEAHSMTVLGDIAQSTGPWARDSWDDVVTALGGGRHVERTELAVGYRVPRQAYEVAARLLPSAAPGVRAPRVVREGPMPAFLRVDDGAARATRVVEQAMAFAGRGLLVGVIRPEAVAEELAAALTARDVRWSDASTEGLAVGINVLTPDEAKGLEFDAVVVVEPELIAGGGGRAGLRSLYVALTRTTRYLTVVHAGRPLPNLTDTSPPATVPALLAGLGTPGTPSSPTSTPTPADDPSPPPEPARPGYFAPAGADDTPTAGDGPDMDDLAEAAEADADVEDGSAPEVEARVEAAGAAAESEDVPAAGAADARALDVEALRSGIGDVAIDAEHDGPIEDGDEDVAVPVRQGRALAARWRRRRRPGGRAVAGTRGRHVLPAEPPPDRPPLGPAPPTPSPPNPAPAATTASVPANGRRAAGNGSEAATVSALADRVARSFADEVREGLAPELWPLVAAALAEHLAAASASLGGGERHELDQGVVE
jgi:hypothetical protein